MIAPYVQKAHFLNHMSNFVHETQLISTHSPLSFNLPLEYTRLVSEHTKRVEHVEHGKPPDPTCIPFGPNHHFQRGKKVPIWISKPVSKSQGKGITLFDVCKISITNPLLMNILLQTSFALQCIFFAIVFSASDQILVP